MRCRLRVLAVAALATVPALAATPTPSPPAIQIVAQALTDSYAARLQVLLCTLPEEIANAGARLRAERPGLPEAELAAFDARVTAAAPALVAACRERVQQALAADDAPAARYGARLRTALGAGLTARELDQARAFLASPAGQHLELQRREADVQALQEAMPWARQVGPALYAELSMMLRAELGPTPGVVAAAPPATSPGRARLRNAQRIGAECAPFYPADARQREQQGSVVLLLRLSETGRLTGLLVESSSGSAALDAAAAACVGAYGQFEPPEADGKPVSSWQRLRWTWRLTE